MASPLVLSNSKANTFRRCEKQFEFKYRMGLRPKDTALPLFRGDWLHQLLMVHADGHSWKERHALLKQWNWDPLFDEEKEELGGNLPEEAERLFKGYLAHYREEDKNWSTVDTEVNEIVELPNGMRLNIIIDRIAEDLLDHSLWIWDYKTVSRFYPLDFMLLDSQLALYFWAAKKIGYRNLRGAVLDELITKPPTKPAILKSGGLAQRKNLHSDAYSYFSYIKELGLNPKDYANFLRFLKSRHGEWWRRTAMPRDEAMVKQVLQEMMATGEQIEYVTKKGVFVRTARKECQYDCSFLEPCMAQLQGADIRPILKIKYQTSKRPDEEDLRRLWPSEAKRGEPRGRG